MYNSIFGTGSPKFVYDPGGSSEHTCILDYSTIERDEPEVKVIKHESELTAERVYKFQGELWNFDVKVNLFKYGPASRSKFMEIYAYKNKLVQLWRHSDGNKMVDSDGNPVMFYISEVTPVQTRDVPGFPDVLQIKFESTKAVDLTNGATVITPTSEVVMLNSI
jgi:hypothetical protein